MAETERSAPTIEEAVQAALQELGADEADVRVEVLQEPRAGFLGLASQAARVRVIVAEAGGSDGDSQGDQADVVADFLEGLLDVMELEADVEIADLPEASYVEIWGPDGGEDMGVLIGRRGLTLDALQSVVRLVVQRDTGERCQVIVDVEDYRKRQRSALVRKARSEAEKARDSGRAVAMEPMTAYERKIVHDTIAELEGLTTVSEGEEPNRHVVVSPTAD